MVLILDFMNREKILKAGKIAAEVKEYARSFIKKDMLLLEIAEKIEDKIVELGGKPAFPTSLAVDDIAAHSTPVNDDESKAKGILKIDLGVHVEGWMADTAFSLDLEDSEENKKMIEASEEALNEAIRAVKENSEIGLNEIGKTIQDTIESRGFSPIANLSGHSMEPYDVHAGVTIPNVDNKNNMSLGEGLYAIEPFATNGNGRVHDGKPSGIYILINSKNVRSPVAREILKFVEEEYNTLPFCSRWIVKKFGTKAIFGLRQLEENENVHHFAQLVESGEGVVSHSEDTLLIEGGEVIVTTRTGAS